jgi:carboxylate-amine ligase
MNNPSSEWQHFRANPKPTLGVEIELAVLQPDTLDLAPRSLDALRALPQSVRDSGHSGSELLLNSIELRTAVCQDIAAVRRDLAATLSALQQTQAAAGVRYCGLGMHPYARWHEQQITPLARPRQIGCELQALAQRASVFGLHVHVGIGTGQGAVALMNAIVPALPMLLALSANSPFCEGRDSGLMSMRRQILASLPRTGLPQPVASWAQWIELVQQLRAGGHVASFRDLWWDVRVNPLYGTLEVRVCDMPSTLDEVIALAALVQAIVVALERGQLAPASEFGACAARAISESNLWSAARYGLRASIVDYYAAPAMPTNLGDATLRLLDRLAPIAAELGSERELCLLRDIACAGSGAARQRRIYADGRSLRGLVQRLNTMIFATSNQDRALAA